MARTEAVAEGAVTVEAVAVAVAAADAEEATDLFP